MHIPSAWRTFGSANCPVSQRIQIWRWVAAWKLFTVKLSSLNRASPPMNWNWTSVSTSPADAAVTIEPSSSKKLHLLPSSAGAGPHQSGLRSNSAPVAASKLVNFHAPVPFGEASSVVPVVKATGVMTDWALYTERDTGGSRSARGV